MFKTDHCYQFVSIWAVLLLTSCGLNPQNADIGLDETLPEAKITIYQQAIDQFGLMTAIYGADAFKIMSKNIEDNTGTSVATNAEVPRDITEMVKSTLNGIGGNVVYIPYEPEFMANMATLGYNNYENKILPQVVLTGGITEFDRGLVTKGDSVEFEIEAGKEYGIDFKDQVKASLSSVTLDFNLIDFNTQTGIPRMQAINGIKLHKATREDSIGFTIKSATFGAQGEVKKVQGRHAAVRLLVQLSMLQLIGRYEKLPYWKLVPGAARDNVVIDSVLADFYAMSPSDQIAKAQEFLYLHGYGVSPTGQMDGGTQSALQSFAKKYNLGSSLNQDLYLALYENLPINAATRQRRNTLKIGGVIASSPQSSPAAPVTPSVASAPITSYSSLAESGQAQASPQPAAQPRAAKPTVEKGEADAGALNLSTNKSEYRIGEKMTINFSVTSPMYVRIALINSKGQIDTVFPNPYQSDNYCKPGLTYSIPSPGADFSLDVGGPAGTDKLRGVASKRPIPAESLAFTNDGQFDDSKMSNFKVRASADYVIR